MLGIQDGHRKRMGRNPDRVAFIAAIGTCPSPGEARVPLGMAIGHINFPATLVFRGDLSGMLLGM